MTSDDFEFDLRPGALNRIKRGLRVIILSNGAFCIVPDALWFWADDERAPDA